MSSQHPGNVPHSWDLVSLRHVTANGTEQAVPAQLSVPVSGMSCCRRRQSPQSEDGWVFTSQKQQCLSGPFPSLLLNHHRITSTKTRLSAENGPSCSFWRVDWFIRKSHKSVRTKKGGELVSGTRCERSWGYYKSCLSSQSKTDPWNLSTWHWRNGGIGKNLVSIFSAAPDWNLLLVNVDAMT